MRSIGVVIGVIIWSLWAVLLTDLSIYECIVSVALCCIGASIFQILLILEENEKRMKK